MTGHFVLTTLHATDSLGVVQRFMDLGIDASQLGGVLQGIFSQRLIRSVVKGRLKGRCAVGEIIPMTPELEALLVSLAPRRDILEYLKTHDIPLLWQNALKLVKEGRTTQEEIERFIPRIEF